MSTGQHTSSGPATSEYIKGNTAQNVDALVGGQDPGGFNPSKPRDEPLTTHGHKPGVLASEADRAPEFSARTLPAGSAPAERTFKPNPVDDVPLIQSNADASSTIQGSTSSDVHTGLGHPGSGQTSSDLHTSSNKSGAGLEGVGAKVEGKLDTIDPRQRGLGREEAGKTAGTRGNVGGLSAEDREAEIAETVAGGRN